MSNLRKLSEVARSQRRPLLRHSKLLARIAEVHGKEAALECLKLPRDIGERMLDIASRNALPTETEVLLFMAAMSTHETQKPASG